MCIDLRIIVQQGNELGMTCPDPLVIGGSKTKIHLILEHTHLREVRLHISQRIICRTIINQNYLKTSKVLRKDSRQATFQVALSVPVDDNNRNNRHRRKGGCPTLWSAQPHVLVL